MDSWTQYKSQRSFMPSKPGSCCEIQIPMLAPRAKGQGPPKGQPEPNNQTETTHRPTPPRAQDQEGKGGGPPRDGNLATAC
eukprot:12423719-Karenia_brevis.AAC.1